QTWRIVGFAFLWGVGIGILPSAFGIPAGVGDVLIGVTAIPIAFFLKRGYRWSKNAAVIWNVLGVVDLVMAISLGLITSSEQRTETGTVTMQTLPWIFIPAVAVPVTLTLHGITLYLLRVWKPMQLPSKRSGV
ncbi:MAG: hypothetical protein ACJ71R_14540, partial [Nitrososphaeraceae archaeon]